MRGELPGVMRRWMLCAVLGLGAYAQGFTNLDFELPRRGPWPPEINAAQLFPGWTPFLEPPFPEFGFPYVLLNDYCIGSPCIGLYSQPAGAPRPARLSVAMDAGGGGPGGYGEMGLRQTGLVPAEARSLRFKASVWGSGGTLVIRLGGRALPLIPVESQADGVVYGADISFAGGQVTELSLGVLADHSEGIRTSASLDDIQFSPAPVEMPGGPPFIEIRQSGPAQRLEIRFSGVLQMAGDPDGPFTGYPGAVSPYFPGVVHGTRFFRTIPHSAPP
ncbi:MAG: hypothetical protein J0L84_14595 [Verrucomicrobia bacterium]|nr:hypothetical protein [Verrucomicrobiota bacterium]